MGTKILRFFPLLFLGVFFALPAHAATIYSQTIHSSTIDNATVDQPVAFTTTGTGTLGQIQFYMGAGAGASNTLGALRILFYGSGGGVSCDTSERNTLGGITVTPTMTLYTVDLAELNCSSSTFALGSYTFEVVGFNAAHSQNSRVATLGSSTSANDAYLIIDTGTIPPPITPPIGDINEVVRYWPGFNYATSSGTTTVGAQFSIAHPEWIEGVGFELSGAPDTGTASIINYVNTLYTATSTVSVPETFSLTTDYNFTLGGYYTVQAFFIQNGQRVYNNNQATILINYVPPNITIGNDGQFHFNGTTTVATSTLDALHIDCGDTVIVSSICKLAVSFFIPDPSAIQQVKDSFAALLTRAPFSFFTESRNVLGGIQGTAGTDRNFSVNLFGNTTNIISASTTAAIGLGEDQRDFMKFLMTIGLWILFAWFLYWRIASIFGV